MREFHSFFRPLVAVAAIVLPSIARAEEGFTVDMKQAVYYLASDELEGRGIGTPGIDKAADYIAGAFKKLGLQAAPGLDGYFQPFTITAKTAPDPKTSVAFGSYTFGVTKDFDVVTGSAEAKFDAPVVFAGYGITSKDHDYDDYAKVDAKGKVVLVLRYEPHDEQGVSRFTKKKDSWSSAATLYRKAKTATDHGAAALLIVSPPKFHEDLAMPYQPSEMKGGLPMLLVRRAVAEKLLKAGNVSQSLGELQDSIDSTGKPHVESLGGVQVRGQVKILQTDTRVKNVVGVVPGKGDLAKEFVVVGAHYDHLGHGGPGSRSPLSHEIHNGADDNASGTVAMMKLAEHYVKNGSPGRSMIFVAFTAEESGLIGSAHFVDQPPVSLDKIAYMLNLDMVGRVRNHVLSVGGTGTAPSFEQLLKQADDASPLGMQTFSKGGFAPSDNTSFAKKKIPVLFFWTGYHEDYHRPTDDAEKVNYDGMEQVVKFSETVLDGLDTHRREEYIATNDNSHSAMALDPGQRGNGEESGRQASLGVLPSYNGDADGVKGVLIDEALPGTAAEEAGLKKGDVIVQFGKDKIQSLEELSDVLGASKPGDKVKLVVVRQGKNVELTATLRERKG